MKTFVCLLVSLVCSIQLLSAQEAVVAAGGNGSGSGGTVSYSVGQPVYTSVTGSGGTVSQGVQQVYTVNVESAIDGTDQILLECLSYPNPVTSILKLFVSETEDISYKLFNETGQILTSDNVNAETSEISVESYNTNTFFLKVFKGNSEVKVFKVIKK